MHNEGKSDVTERFIRTLNNKIYKYMTSISKNVYIDKLDDISCNKTYYITIKMKPTDVNPSMYIDFNKENNKTDPKFKVGDNVRISKYKNIFRKGYIPNWSEEVFVTKKSKTLCRGYMLLVILTEKKLLEKKCFVKKKHKNKFKKV